MFILIKYTLFGICMRMHIYIYIYTGFKQNMHFVCTQGDVEAVKNALQTSRRSMTSVLSLDELPEFDGEETEELKHMRIEQLVSWYSGSCSKCEVSAGKKFETT